MIWRSKEAGDTGEACVKRKGDGKGKEGTVVVT